MSCNASATKFNRSGANYSTIALLSREGIGWTADSLRKCRIDNSAGVRLLAVLWENSWLFPGDAKFHLSVDFFEADAPDFLADIRSGRGLVSVRMETPAVFRPANPGGRHRSIRKLHQAIALRLQVCDPRQAGYLPPVTGVQMGVGGLQDHLIRNYREKGFCPEPFSVFEGRRLVPDRHGSRCYALANEMNDLPSGSRSANFESESSLAVSSG